LGCTYYYSSVSTHSTYTHIHTRMLRRSASNFLRCVPSRPVASYRGILAAPRGSSVPKSSWSITIILYVHNMWFACACVCCLYIYVLRVIVGIVRAQSPNDCFLLKECAIFSCNTSGNFYHLIYMHTPVTSSPMYLG